MERIREILVQHNKLLCSANDMGRDRMNPVVLFWSRNPDLYMLFSYIFGIAGFTSTLIDDEELGEMAARAPVLAIIL